MLTFLRKWVLPALVIALTAGAAVAGAFIEDDGKVNWWPPTVLAIVCTVGAGAMALTERILSDRVAGALADEQTDVAVAINDLLEPLMYELGNALAATGQERARLLQRVVPTCLSAAANLLGSNRTRASFFRLDETGTNYKLRPEESRGRAGMPRTVFDITTDPGRQLFDRLVNEPGYDFCADTAGDITPGRRPNPDYRCYLAVLAHNGGKVAGAVTVDSPLPGDLSSDDRHFLNIVATMISIAVTESGSI